MRYTMRKAGIEMATCRVKASLTRAEVEGLKKVLKGGGYPTSWTVHDLLASFIQDGLFRTLCDESPTEARDAGVQ